MDLVTVGLALMVLLGVICLWDGLVALKRPHARSLLNQPLVTQILLLGAIGILYLVAFVTISVWKGVFLTLGVLCLISAVALLSRLPRYPSR